MEPDGPRRGHHAAGPHLPWWRALGYRSQPRSLRSLTEWLEREDPARRFRGTWLLHSYLLSASDGLRSSSDLDIAEVLALGLFTNRRSKPVRVPLVAILKPRADLVSELLNLGEALAPTFLTYEILPDLHLVRAPEARELELEGDDEWRRTLEQSISLVRHVAD
jgi:hypothetical protein